MTPLAPTESLLWQGRPHPSPWPPRRDLISILVGLVFTLFACFWIAAAAASPVWPFGLIFVGFGLKLALWDPFAPYFRLRATTYTLTTQRAVITTTFPRPHTTEIAITPTLLIDFDRDDPLSDLYFGAQETKNGLLRRDTRPGFLRIEGGPTVLSHIRRIQGRAP